MVIRTLSLPISYNLLFHISYILLFHTSNCDSSFSTYFISSTAFFILSYFNAFHMSYIVLCRFYFILFQILHTPHLILFTPHNFYDASWFSYFIHRIAFLAFHTADCILHTPFLSLSNSYLSQLHFKSLTLTIKSLFRETPFENTPKHSSQVIISKVGLSVEAIMHIACK